MGLGDMLRTKIGRCRPASQPATRGETIIIIIIIIIIMISSENTKLILF
jgi:hypothetical protein